MIIRATFPRGVFYGTDTPVPHPARLMSAMVASYYGAESQDPAEYEVLKKLEATNAPAISCPTVYKRLGGTHFVKVNNKQSELKGRKYPAVTVDGPIDYHVECGGQLDPELIGRIVERIPYLGSSHSTASLMILDDGDSEPNLFPGGSFGDNSSTMRTWYRGYLRQLEKTNDRNEKSLNSRGTIDFRPRTVKVTYGDEPAEPVAGEFGSIICLSLEGPQLAGTIGPKVCRALRKKLMAIMPDPIPALVSGHNPDGSVLKKSHVSFQSLLFSDAKHADGHLMGVGICLPTGTTHDERFQILGALSNLNSVSTEHGTWKVGRFDDRWSLNPSRYQSTSRLWATTTPIELPYFPRKHKPAYGIIAECCETSGLPKPERVDVRPAPFVLGGYDARHYKQERGLLVHARIKFRQPVSGPVAIGRGRYLGFGLCIADRV